MIHTKKSCERESEFSKKKLEKKIFFSSESKCLQPDNTLLEFLKVKVQFFSKGERSQ